MPPLWPYLLLLVPAVPLARADFRTRRVAVVWLAALGVVAFCVEWRMQGLGATLLGTAVNAVLLSALLGAMACYHTLRGKPVNTFFRCSFGPGDAILMLAVAPLFTPAGYVRFLLAGSLAALAWWCATRAKTIPLAGILTLVLAAWTLCKTFGLWN